MGKRVVFGLCVTMEEEYLVYDTRFNTLVEKGEAIDKDEYGVGYGYYASCTVDTDYVALCFCEPSGMQYIPLQLVDEEVKHDFSILAQKKEGMSGNSNKPYYTYPYCDTFIIDTKTFDVVFDSEAMDEIPEVTTKSEGEAEKRVHEIVAKYEWCIPESWSLEDYRPTK